MPLLSKRTRFVWLSFFAALTAVCGLLAVLSGGHPTPLMAASAQTVAENGPDDPIMPRQAVLDQNRWTAILIHHSGRPTGDAASVRAQHLGYGFAGLGHHFLIGNGNGLGNGVIHVGARWNNQQPGAHAIGSQSSELNQHAISICLIGNGDQRGFTDTQMRQLVRLVRRLQRDMGIPASSVKLHSDFADISDPGRFFPKADFETQLLP